MTIFELHLFWMTIAPTYYWAMYALWFLAWYFIIKYRQFLSIKQLDDLFLYIYLGVVLGWRLGYVLFYDFYYYLSTPLDIIKVWEWWMSFHGWVIWVIIAMFLFTKKHKINFLNLSDQVTLVLPIWLWLGRIWNYLNWELLWFSNYTWFLAYYKNGIWYFPSTLVEFLLEGVLLFIILNFLYIYKKFNSGQIASLFLILYWIFRIFVEIFFRIPDAQIGYILGFLTMWEILSFPMVIIWSILFFRFKKNSL